MRHLPVTLGVGSNRQIVYQGWSRDAEMDEPQGISSQSMVLEYWQDQHRSAMKMRGSITAMRV
jgi:hypothetical protein